MGYEVMKEIELRKVENLNNQKLTRKSLRGI
jgi:hypothetical protein